MNTSISRSESVKSYLEKINDFKKFLSDSIGSGVFNKTNYEHYVDLAAGYSQLEKDLDWELILSVDEIMELKAYSSLNRTEIDYVLGPYFVMCGAVLGKNVHVGVVNNPHVCGRGNVYLLVRTFLCTYLL